MNNVALRGSPKAKITIGSNVFFGDGTQMMCFESITVGDDTMIAAGTFITDLNHGTEKGKLMREQPIETKPTFIGKDVWIGANSVILKGSIIHDGAVIGAGAVVKGEIPENAIAVGVPAKVIKYRK
jgi:acetyltransferase-like isoleucine patch superfamily enzyme